MTYAPPFTLESAPAERDLLRLLELERLDTDLYRSTYVAPDDMALYGGQVAAQALAAAGATVPEDRLPHSLHGYFLRRGDAALPTVFVVHQDRDGRSFSARRVEARQAGRVIFSTAVSFQTPEDGPDLRCDTMPDTAPPEECEPIGLPRLVSFEGRAPAQPYEPTPWPVRFWSRTTAALGDDPLLQACALTYLSDISSGLAPLSDEHSRPGSSLDHAVWFHRPARLEDWVLTDLVPHQVAGGRGWYTGTLYDRGGTPVASTTQECLFRSR
jgi:acyl-CoA thioesterase II